MSPDSKARIARVAMNLLRDGAAIAKRGAGADEALRYAQTILESVVEEEVQKRAAARDGG